MTEIDAIIQSWLDGLAEDEGMSEQARFLRWAQDVMPNECAPNWASDESSYTDGAAHGWKARSDLAAQRDQRASDLEGFLDKAAELLGVQNEPLSDFGDRFLQACGEAQLAAQREAELEEERARVAELHERLSEYHDNAHYGDEGELYIGCCITESQYQDTAKLLSRTQAQPRSEVERLQELVESAFSEGFWNGLCTCRELTDDDWKRLKKQYWQSSKSYKALRGEAEG